MPTAYISLGSNLGDRAGNLLLGIRGIMDAGLQVARVSKIYETTAVETFEQPKFLNMVAELKAEELPEPESLLARLLRVEYALGRRREVEKGPRTLDLDLLLYGKEVRDSEFLKLPHPRLHARRFVLVPLVELIPTAVHPVLKKSFENLLRDSRDSGDVNLWQPN